jgi:HK97 family phage prohead protease
MKNNQELKRAYSIPDIRATTIPNEGEADQHRIEGHAAVFGQETVIWGMFKEVIERGAFDNTDFDDVVFTANHDLRKIPLARSRRNNGNSTLYLEVDDKGLFVRANLDTENNSESKSLYSAVGRSDIDGMSFIFYVKDEEWEDLDSEMPTRRIKGIAKVREVSAVNFPAYEGTDINTAREVGPLDNAKMVLDNARSEGLDNSSEVEILRLKNQILANGGK